MLKCEVLESVESWNEILFNVNSGDYWTAPLHLPGLWGNKLLWFYQDFSLGLEWIERGRGDMSFLFFWTLNILLLFLQGNETPGGKTCVEPQTYILFLLYIRSKIFKYYCIKYPQSFLLDTQHFLISTRLKNGSRFWFI